MTNTPEKPGVGTKIRSGPYSIGSDTWPGISKLIEECGEVVQVCGKILGTGGKVEHWDGTKLDERLASELGDLLAALRFVALRCGLDRRAVEHRAAEKQALFQRWHEEQR